MSALARMKALLLVAMTVKVIGSPGTGFGGVTEKAFPVSKMGTARKPSDLWTRLSAVHVEAPDTQTPAVHMSPLVQLLPSSQPLPSAFVGFVHAPVDGSQLPPLWHWSSATQVTVVPEQFPPWHASAVVQALPSLQVVPSALLGFEHVPFAGSHDPAAWHWSCATHVTGFPPWQSPAWQVSVCVQAFPSLHGVPLASSGFVQVPVVWSHIPGP
jgi:hypothetical protein